MNVMCCGVEVDTRFCPRCGKHLEINQLEVLRELLEHIETTATKYHNDSTRMAGAGTMVGKHHLNTAKKAHTKWQRWYDALIQVVKEKEAAGMDIGE